MASSSRTNRRPEGGSVDDKCEAFPGVSSTTVNTRNSRPSVKVSLTKVQAPALVGLIRHDDRTPCIQGAFTAAPFAHLQLLFGIELPELLDVHLDALSLQHHMKATIWPRPKSFLSGVFSPSSVATCVARQFSLRSWKSFGLASNSHVR